MIGTLWCTMSEDCWECTVVCHGSQDNDGGCFVLAHWFYSFSLKNWFNSMGVRSTIVPLSNLQIFRWPTALVPLSIMSFFLPGRPRGLPEITSLPRQILQLQANITTELSQPWWNKRNFLPPLVTKLLKLRQYECFFLEQLCTKLAKTWRKLASTSAKTSRHCRKSIMYLAWSKPYKPIPNNLLYLISSTAALRWGTTRVVWILVQPVDSGQPSQSSQQGTKLTNHSGFY